jgi:hypothetical protein
MHVNDEPMLDAFGIYVSIVLLACFLIMVCSCQPATDELGTAEQAAVGNVGTDPNPLSVWWYATADTHQDRIRGALECGLDRWNAAACLGMNVSFNARHWARFKDLGGPGKASIGGTWESSRIAMDFRNAPELDCPFMVHEMCHLLRRSNGHLGNQCDSPTSPSSMISSDDLIAVCAARDCACFIPETP